MYIFTIRFHVQQCVHVVSNANYTGHALMISMQSRISERNETSTKDDNAEELCQCQSSKLKRDIFFLLTQSDSILVLFY